MRVLSAVINQNNFLWRYRSGHGLTGVLRSYVRLSEQQLMDQDQLRAAHRHNAAVSPCRKYPCRNVYSFREKKKINIRGISEHSQKKNNLNPQRQICCNSGSGMGYGSLSNQQPSGRTLSVMYLRQTEREYWERFSQFSGSYQYR